MANDERRRDAAASDAQGEDVPSGRDIADVRRHGLPGKGFDPGSGYGGAGNASAYSGENSFGGRAGEGGGTTRGAYVGGAQGRSGERDAGDEGGGERERGRERERGSESGADRDAQRGRADDRQRSDTGAPRGAEIERGTDEQGPRNELDVDGAFGSDSPLGGERRDELR